MPDSMKIQGHMTPSEAGALGTQASVKQLILTHFYPPCDEVDVLTAAQVQLHWTNSEGPGFDDNRIGRLFLDRFLDKDHYISKLCGFSPPDCDSSAPDIGYVHDGIRRS